MGWPLIGMHSLLDSDHEQTPELDYRWSRPPLLAMGVALSHRIEPGVRVQKVTLAGDTPALKFIPAGPGPHPVALLAHGYASRRGALSLRGGARRRRICFL